MQREHALDAREGGVHGREAPAGGRGQLTEGRALAEADLQQEGRSRPCRREAGEELAVGVEAADDLIADLEQALA